MKKVILSMKKWYYNVLSLFKKEKKTEVICHQTEVRELSQLHLQKSDMELICQVEDFLKATYDFRFNQLTEITEYKPRRYPKENYQPVGQRELNTFCMEARRNGINCWDRDISRYVYSRSINSYNPFTEYMDTLPEWDQTDYISPLAKRVSIEPIWVDGFHTWMLAMVAQWMGISSTYANSVAPVLVSRKQGINKSTFCRMLMPDPLQNYFTDSFDIGSSSGAEQKLTAFGLINLDELDKYSERKMALLKNLMQMAGINIRKAHKKSYSSLPRIASFIATSNRRDLLTDPTGSRRFLCVDVEKKIDCSPINHAQIYSQLKAELFTGQRAWFTNEEEAIIMENNEAFQKRSLAEDIFHSCFRLPANDEKGYFLSAAQIYNELKKQYPSSARQLSPATFGKTLIMLGVERKHTKQGNYYHVVINN